MKFSIAPILAMLAVLMSGCDQSPLGPRPPGTWLAGDFHNHTFLTDGNHTLSEVVSKGFSFGLDWMANSEHGGAYGRDPLGRPWDETIARLGNPPKGKMWRWQSLWQQARSDVRKLGDARPDKLLLLGYEWNVPGHDHASVGIVGPPDDSALALAQHEYLFDVSDTGTDANGILGVEGKIVDSSHKKALAGVAWLEERFPDNSYCIVNHPSRLQQYSVADLRDLNNAAPRVVFGFEGVPGHQKSSWSRGGYGHGPLTDPSGRDVTDFARTYGGADWMLAKVGGAWDALLGESRAFYAFANSDFHSPEGDFWPGEYAKTHTLAHDTDRNGVISQDELLDGLRSGTTFFALGGLIDGLDFSIGCRRSQAGMGETLTTDHACGVDVEIRFHVPNPKGASPPIDVDHIDLIAGETRGRIPKFLADGRTPNPDYQADTNATTAVVATFTARDWVAENPSRTDSPALGGGGAWRVIRHRVEDVNRNTYFRLRGTNLGCGVPNETDDQCNPVRDELAGENSQPLAMADLWFYSNPIFVRVRD